MDVVLWVVEVLLAVVFVVAGLFKATQPKQKLKESGLAWVDSFSEPQVKAIGVVEVLGAVGIVVPPAVGVAEWLAPLAALGLAITMIGAIVTHVLRREYPMVVPPLVLGLLAAFVAWGRFGPYPF